MVNSSPPLWRRSKLVSRDRRRSDVKRTSSTTILDACPKLLEKKFYQRLRLVFDAPDLETARGLKITFYGLTAGVLRRP